MLFVKPSSLSKLLSILCFLFLMTGCVEDLAPSNDDKRSAQSTTTENFTLLTTTGETLELDQLLAENNAVVLYFTMWCPLCDSHMGHMSRSIIPEYPDTRFIMVDYVSSTVSQSYRSQIENGYQSQTVVADLDQSLLNRFNATMASTIVVSQEGQILLNEDYKNGERLKAVLAGL